MEAGQGILDNQTLWNPQLFPFLMMVILCGGRVRKALKKPLIWIESMHYSSNTVVVGFLIPVVVSGLWYGVEEEQLYEFLDFLWSRGRARVTFSIGHSTLSLRSREIGTFHNLKRYRSGIYWGIYSQRRGRGVLEHNLQFE